MSVAVGVRASRPLTSQNPRPNGIAKQSRHPKIGKPGVDFFYTLLYWLARTASLLIKIHIFHLLMGSGTVSAFFFDEDLSICFRKNRISHQSSEPLTNTKESLP
jgi:hypothetical protein